MPCPMLYGTVLYAAPSAPSSMAHDCNGWWLQHLQNNHGRLCLLLLTGGRWRGARGGGDSSQHHTPVGPTTHGCPLIRRACTPCSGHAHGLHGWYTAAVEGGVTASSAAAAWISAGVGRCKMQHLGEVGAAYLPI